MNRMLDREEGTSRAAALTPREAQVLELAAGGLTNPEVAMRLNISVHAVKFHLGSVFRKLNVANRTEAAVTYLRTQGVGAESGGGE
jgi:DNA-binding CsgD family transcriptional regulator